MLRNRMAAAKDVAEKLVALESAIDDALLCAAELSLSASKGRKTANISAMVGQDALNSTAKTYASLMEARSQIVDAHGAYADVRDQIGLRTFAGGMYGDCVEGKIGAANEEEAATPIIYSASKAA